MEVNVLYVLSSLIFAAAVVEAVLEFLFAPWLARLIKASWLRDIVIRWLGAVVGVLVCALFGLDLLGITLASLGVQASYPVLASWVGIVLTGLLSARGANWLHDFGSQFLGLDGHPWEE